MRIEKKVSGKAKLQVQYGMNNYKQKNAAKGKELLIKNYCSSPEFKEKAEELKLEDVQKTHQISNELFSTIKAENIAIKDF